MHVVLTTSKSPILTKKLPIWTTSFKFQTDLENLRHKHLHMSIASTRSRTRGSIFTQNNLSDSVSLGNSVDRSFDNRYRRGMDRAELKLALAGPNTDLEIATGSLEGLSDNQSAHHPLSDFRSNRIGGNGHVEGSHDGTDEAGNIGFSEAALSQTDGTARTWGTFGGADHTPASSVHAQGFQGRAVIPDSKGIFAPTGSLNTVLLSTFTRGLDMQLGQDHGVGYNDVGSSNAIQQNRQAINNDMFSEMSSTYSMPMLTNQSPEHKESKK